MPNECVPDGLFPALAIALAKNCYFHQSELVSGGETDRDMYYIIGHEVSRHGFEDEGDVAKILL